MKSTVVNDVKVYNLGAEKRLPDWVNERKRRRMAKEDFDLRQRIELVQDFEMPHATTDIQISGDGSHIFATGTYPPRVRCYELSQMSMKYERFMDFEPIRVIPLTEDYKKFVVLQENRYLEFHAQYGKHYRTRIPAQGRDMCYDPYHCNLFLAGASRDLYRVNLEEGRFLEPLTSPVLPRGSEFTCVNVTQTAPFLTFAGLTSGHVCVWDNRTRDHVAMLNVPDLLGDVATNAEISSVKVSPNALHIAVGTSTGQVALFDIRSAMPTIVKDHQYGYPIHSMHFHDTQTQSNIVISADRSTVRMWDRDTGENFTSIESEVPINRVTPYPNSGLVLLACEQPRIMPYYIPQLGMAPTWCSFLDNLTEELEEKPRDYVFDDYKFVTRKELDELGLTNLLGTKMLKAYMHGFFMDMRLYEKAKLVAQPFAYEEYRQKRIQEKLDEERGQRIRIKQNLPKINKEYAKVLLRGDKDAAGKKKKSKEGAETNPMADDRFGALFTKEEFEIDPKSEEYRRLHPSGGDLNATLRSQFAEADVSDGDDVNPDMGPDLEDSRRKAEEDSSDDDEDGGDEDETEDDSDDEDQDRRQGKGKAAAKLYELRDGQQGLTLDAEESKRQAAIARLPFHHQIKLTGGDRTTKGSSTSMRSGALEVTYNPNAAKERKEREEMRKSRRQNRERRTVRDLKLKKLNPQGKFWKGRKVG
eukprot:Clim_evm37s236 gene=Clim_evmTU37s236